MSIGEERHFTPFTNEEREYSRYAGFWKRVGASLLDGLVFALPIAIISWIMFGFSNQNGSTNLFSFIAGFLYKTLMESSPKQGTLGKMIMGIKVTGLNGERISFGRAVGRYFASFISSFSLGIGFLMAGWTKKKQALHDMIAGTLVLNK